VQCFCRRLKINPPAEEATRKRREAVVLDSTTSITPSEEKKPYSPFSGQCYQTYIEPENCCDGYD